MAAPAKPSPVASFALPSRDELPARVEQRAHVRIEARGPARLRGAEGEGRGEVRNVSAHGAFIATRFSLKPGERVAVDLDLGGRHRVNGTAIVRWIRPGNDEPPEVESGVGIEFAPLETGALDTLANFIRARRESPGFSHPLLEPT